MTESYESLDINTTPPPLIDWAYSPDHPDFNSDLNPTVARADVAADAMKWFHKPAAENWNYAYECIHEIEALPPELIPDAARERIAIARKLAHDGGIAVSLSPEEVSLLSEKFHWPESVTRGALKEYCNG